MNFRIDTLGKRIGLGYALMALVLTVAVLVTIKQVKEVSTTATALIEVRQPSARADLQLLNGVNHSIAALRGWVLLRRDTFKTERAFAWKEEINVPASQLESLTDHWVNRDNVKLFFTLRPMLNQLAKYQDAVEDLALTDTDSAVKLMDEKVLPLNKEIRDLITVLMVYHEKRMVTEFDTIQKQIVLLNNIEWMLLVIGLVISSILALLITQSITQPLANAVQVAQNIGGGNLTTQVNVDGTKELEALGSALTNMRDSLRQKTEQTERYEWLSNGKNSLNESMRGDKDVGELASEVIAFIAKYAQATIGSVYLLDDAKNELVLAGQYAFGEDGSHGKFKMGEGLIGQVAADKQSILLSELDEKNLRIRSSLVDASPKNVLVVPFLFEGQVLGVMELGKFAAFDAAHREFVESNMESVGIALSSSVARRKIKELLEETQRQSEELQQQQEELQQSNEELEEHTQQLKEQQEELQAANEELEEQTQVVQQKNSDLESARMDIELKAKQLEISSKYKSEFLANMSHELRTPLNSLLILSNDLAANKQGNLDEEQVESAEIVAKSGYDLLNLINEILDLSKIEAGKMDLNINEAAVSDIAADITKNFKRNAEAKGLILEVKVDEALPSSINTDRQRLDQVIKNLVSNALKFTENGTVSVHMQRDAGDQLAIAVKDTGIGIPKDKLDIVFEAFQQADGGTSRKYGGTGLGLSISRELAKLLGGRITLQSIPGQGSTFTLFIPLNVVDKKEKPVELPSTDERKAPFETESKFVNYPSIADQRNDILPENSTILIIEDDANFAKILADQAKEKGFKYLSASTGEDGLMLAAQFYPNAIILDLDLPGIDGNMVLKELKGNPNLRHIPVHIISANEKTLDPIRSGAVEYLTKPVTKQQLEEAFGRMEELVNRKMKNLLIIEDNDGLRRSIVKLIGNGDVKSFEAATAKQALEIFSKETIDCIVLDIGLPDMSGFELVKELEKLRDGRIPPIIVYTGKELTKKENEELQQYAETIIVKGVKSEERLLDETALFLHRTVRNLPEKTQQMITGLYDKETMFQGGKVLLVDDDMRNVFALGKVLKEKGLEILKAENGKIALQVLNENKDVDIVLMDIMMPEMDGYECMKEIRKQKRFKDLPVIALTAKAMKEDRQTCIDAGANDYITKPVDVERLFSLMRIWIRK
ncbi:MAG: response regulator [Flavobacteriales bacterium]|nr:response regulator [Flavobacteriales bacterium]